MLWQTGFAFDSAVVDTIVFFGHVRSATEIGIVIKLEDSSYFRSFDSFLSNTLLKIDYRNTEEQNLFLKRILSNCDRLESFATVKAGVKLYEKGKGNPPQSSKIVQEKPFTVLGTCPQGWRRLIRGIDIGKYSLRFSNEFISYGSWLAAPRDSEMFEGERIIMRRTDDRIFSTLINGDAVCANSCHVIKLSTDTLSYKYLLGVLNSRLIQFLFEIQNPQMVGKTFAEIKVIYISSLPVVKPPRSLMIKLEKLVVKALGAKESDSLEIMEIQNAIDQLVYELYGLTEQEVKIVEGGENA